MYGEFKINDTCEQESIQLYFTLYKQELFYGVYKKKFPLNLGRRTLEVG